MKKFSASDTFYTFILLVFSSTFDDVQEEDTP